MIEVANPIYDVVFKYLLDDNKIAKLLISGLLKQEVLELELKPQEYTSDLEKRTLTIYRVDFKAKIKLHNGEEKVVLIEIQKAKFTSDIMRFRKYLGEQYANKGNVKKTEYNTIALPIITIYFLGYPLKSATDIPIIRVARQYLDHSSNKVLKIKEYFIESLTHDSIIVQIIALKNKKRKNELEKALSVFEQGTKHEVSVNEDDYPEKYKPIIRCLLKALADNHIRKTMDVEDEILADLEDKERFIVKMQRENEEKGRAIIQAQIENAEKERLISKAQIENAEMQKENENKERLISEVKKEKETLKLTTAKALLKAGISVKEIVKITGLSAQTIEKL